MNQHHVFEVFIQWKAGSPAEHVGEVEAPDPDTALLAAKEHFARRDRCTSIWVADRTCVHSATWDPDTLTAGHRKLYRRSLGKGHDPDILSGRL